MCTCSRPSFPNAHMRALARQDLQMRKFGAFWDHGFLRTQRNRGLTLATQKPQKHFTKASKRLHKGAIFWRTDFTNFFKNSNSEYVFFFEESRADLAPSCSQTCSFPIFEAHNFLQRGFPPDFVSFCLSFSGTFSIFVWFFDHPPSAPGTWISL